MSENATLLSGGNAPAPAPPAATPASPAAGTPAASTGAPATPATPATPAAQWTWADESGKFNDGWVDKLGDEFKGNATLQTINSVPLLAKAYLDTKKMVGQKVAPPTDQSKPEEVAAWRKTVGAPENAEGYGALMPKDFPKELWDTGIETSAKELALKHHLTPAALADFATLQAEGTKAAYARETQAAAAKLQADGAALNAEWGDQFERRMSEAKALAAALGLPAEHPLFTDVSVVRAFAASAPTLLGPAKLIEGTPPSVSGGLQERIDNIRNGPDYQGKTTPDKQLAAAAQLRQFIAAQDAQKRRSPAA